MKEKIKIVEKIARLELSEQEREEFIPQLEEILKFFDQIKKIDVDATDFMVQPLDLENVWREDREKESLTKSDIFRNTKNRKEDLFKGPRIK